MSTVHNSAGVVVRPVRFTDEAECYAVFLHALGLRGTADDSYAVFSASVGDHGCVGVHHVYAGDLPIAAAPGASCHLTFPTTEDLVHVSERVAAAGHGEVALSREDFGGLLSVTDPDGQEVQIHEAAGER